MRPLLLATLLLAAAVPARAAPGDQPAATAPQNATPDAASVLFERPHMKNAAPGATLAYDYLRRSGIDKGPFGPPLNDQIKLTVEPGSAEDNRSINVQMFSGGNRVPAGPFRDMAGNPVLSLFLENHLKGLSGLLGANPRYLKNAIRKGLRESATVIPETVTFKGRQVEAWRIEMEPYKGDKQTERMRGFDNTRYVFIASPEVPGEILSIEARARSDDGGELLEERLSYDQNPG